ncbi:MAG: glycosyltransferase family 4 protein, partial [Chitinophagales bacterium]|nr:glycosyltransferase family 4 protein [Chitinophagales bacterium]MDW8273381.1 glycosyltransferase family 4 protein [Chitinophagales bacterium]
SAVDDIGNLLEQSHIGLLSSLSEGCPNSILEYISFGLPVLATRIEAITDVLGDDYEFLFEPGNEFDFAEKALKLLSSSELRKQTAGHLQRNVLPHYALNNMIQQFNMLIREDLRI